MLVLHNSCTDMYLFGSRLVGSVIGVGKARPSWAEQRKPKWWHASSAILRVSLKSVTFTRHSLQTIFAVRSDTAVKQQKYLLAWQLAGLISIQSLFAILVCITIISNKTFLWLNHCSEMFIFSITQSLKSIHMLNQGIYELVWLILWSLWKRLRPTPPSGRLEPQGSRLHLSLLNLKKTWQ